ncbi:heparinase II/III family protein [Candidatus Poribacteria bacterium]|nr:heparinase II/III family protein [Candidatus Poribacteria bacterium]
MVGFVCALMISGVNFEPGIPPNPTATLKRDHPRLIITRDELERVKRAIGENEMARRYFERIKRQADKILSEPPVRYEIPDGLRLLGVSRRCLNRIYHLATMFRLSGDRRYKERAVRELKAAANFPDWNPRHFLDTAEMTHAFAIGYDWLYDSLSDGERRMIREAIIEKGIDPALRVYERGGWWAKCNHNWNQVCNGGIAIGALAIADEIPDLADRVLGYALESIKIPMRMFNPDGGWAEGPGYWNYATSYNVYLLAALETALGTDFGLSDMPGFSETGYFCIYMTGPLWKTFNYADSGDRAPHASQMFWLARRFDKPVYAWYQHHMASHHVHPLDLLWFDPRSESPSEEGLPLDRWFHNVNVVFLRSRWEDERAIFIGFKGGDNKANHSHLDLGSFVLDADGHRWAVDLGADDYNIPGYFGRQRWSYYRLRTEGHNTITLNGENQDPHAEAPIVDFKSTPDLASAAADLSAAYGDLAEKVLRTVSLVERRYVLIRDVIKAREPVEVAWNMHTPASVKVEGSKAMLSQNGATLLLEVIEPKDAIVESHEVSIPPPQRPIKGIRKITVRPPSRVESVEILIRLTPLDK